MSDLMRAAIVEGPTVLHVRDIQRPVLSDYTAICEIQYGTICSGTDTRIVDGVFPYHVAYPTILGHESVGRVTQIGIQVRNLRVGDLVTRVGYSLKVNLARLGVVLPNMVSPTTGAPCKTMEYQ